MKPSMFDKKMVAVTGLPRAGSTLLCQLLAHHPAIFCTGQSSPLPQFLAGLRKQAADNEFMLAQLDHDPELGHERLLNAYRGFVGGWFAEADAPVVVDKNRAWLDQLDLAERLDPGCRMLVCVRDLGQILGSIEARHQQTLALDFADHSGTASAYDRANRLFARDGVVGLPLYSFRNAQDLPPASQKRIMCVVFEQLIADPAQVLAGVWDFLGLESHAIDFSQLAPLPGESDSHYRLKYSHKTSNSLKSPRRHAVPQRIEAELRNTFDWFYRIFYP
jgi:sulfotransferase